jgi:hypothetical protein
VTPPRQGSGGGRWRMRCARRHIDRRIERPVKPGGNVFAERIVRALRMFLDLLAKTSSPAMGKARTDTFLLK